jgi:hypothetical protein
MDGGDGVVDWRAVKVFESHRQAAKSLRIRYALVYLCLQGKLTHARGHRLRQYIPGERIYIAESLPDAEKVGGEHGLGQPLSELQDARGTKAVVLLDLVDGGDGVVDWRAVKVFKSLTEAAKALGLNRRRVYLCVKGKLEHVEGHHLRKYIPGERIYIAESLPDFESRERLVPVQAAKRARSGVRELARVWFSSLSKSAELSKSTLRMKAVRGVGKAGTELLLAPKPHLSNVDHDNEMLSTQTNCWMDTPSLRIQAAVLLDELRRKVLRKLRSKKKQQKPLG